MDTTIFTNAADFIARHQAWAGVVMGVFTFIESLVLVGAFVPATPLMVVAGGLIAAGVLDPFSVLSFCTLGCVLGDAVSFEIGRKLGGRALYAPMFASQRRNIARVRLITRRYGGASILIGRFFGPLRAFVPTAAGMARMPRSRFQRANIVSAVIWVPIMLTPGYFAAKGLEELAMLGETNRFAPVLILVAAVLSLSVFVWRIFARRAALPAPQRPLPVDS